MSEQFLVVGIDGSEDAQRALDWAAEEAERRGATLRVLHSWLQVGEGFRAEQTARKAMLSATEAHPQVKMEVEVPHLAAAEALIRASNEAELLVVGPRGLGGFRELLLGSVSHQCALHATCPVTIVRRRPQGLKATSNKIVVGVDDSPGSKSALRWALQEARLRKSDLQVCYAWQYPPVGSYVVAPPDGYIELQDRVLETSQALAAEEAPDIVPEWSTINGPPAPTLIDASGNAELLVVGARGHGGFRGLLAGSVSQEVIHHANCPVVVVRAQPETGGT